MILPTKSLYETHENQNGFSRKSKTILVSFVTRIKNSFVPLSSISIQLNMANVYEERLGTDRMLPLIFRMALPAIAAQLVNLLYSIVDRIYIGHIPEIGTQALAGVGVTSSIIILISSFSAFVGAGGSPLAAIALGQGDRVRAGKILGNGFILLIIFTLLTSLTTYLFMRPLLFLTGASKQTIGYAVDYLSVYLLGTLFVELSVGLNTFINTQGRPAIAMCSVLIGAILNILLDPLFIFAFGLGVKSAMLIVSVPLTGFAQGFVPIVSYNYGHLNKERVKSCFKIVLIFMFSFNLILILAMILFPEILATAFTNDPQLIVVVEQFMPIFLAGMTIFGLQRACQNMFVALGQAKVSVFIALLRKVFLLIPLALILPHFMGVTGVFAAEAFSDATAAICCTLIFSVQFPKILKRMKENLSEAQ